MRQNSFNLNLILLIVLLAFQTVLSVDSEDESHPEQEVEVIETIHQTENHAETATIPVTGHSQTQTTSVILIMAAISVI